MPAPPFPVSGPLEIFAAGFARELSRQGYTSTSAGAQLYVMAHLSRWLAGEGLDVHRLGPSEIDRFLNARRAAGYTQYLSGKALHPLLAYVRALRVVPLPQPAAPTGRVAVTLERYRHYLTVERGLRPVTASGYLHAVRPFLLERVAAAGGALELAGLGAADVLAFVRATCPSQRPGTAQLTVTALRSFLGFLHVVGEIPHALGAYRDTLRLLLRFAATRRSRAVSELDIR